MINLNEILKILPHRYPFILIDRVIELVPQQSIVAIKNVTINEPFFVGHFPENPVMPGVLVIEAMAQAAAILVAKSMNYTSNGMTPYLAKVSEARFKKPVVPGDTLTINVKLDDNKGKIWFASSHVTVDEQVVAQSSIVAAMQGQ